LTRPCLFNNITDKSNKFYYKFSNCFKCHNPILAIDNQIICLNGCFKLDNILTDEFNERYPLSTFLNEYHQFLSYHEKCQGEITPIYIGNENLKSYFICNKCDGKTFEAAGIIL